MGDFNRFDMIKDKLPQNEFKEYPKMITVGAGKEAKRVRVNSKEEENRIAEVAPKKAAGKVELPK